MTIPVSTVDTVKDFLVAGILAAVSDPTVLVSYDMPGPYQPDDIVVVGDITVTTEPHAFVGNGQAHWLSEEYTVEVIISVYRGGDTASVAWKRAKVLSDLVDTLIRTDPTLGAVVQLAYPSKTEFVSDVTENHSGRMVTVTKEITCNAEL